MRISDWSSDVCSADLCHRYDACGTARSCWPELSVTEDPFWRRRFWVPISVIWARALLPPQSHWRRPPTRNCWYRSRRSEEHTSELQSLMRISYAVFCLKKKTTHKK